jgi:hypothetical protein
MVSWERMAQREQETRTWGFVAWSLAVCAGYRAKPVMDAYIYVIELFPNKFIVRCKALFGQK